jgi:hypothetical protein
MEVDRQAHLLVWRPRESWKRHQSDYHYDGDGRASGGFTGWAEVRRPCRAHTLLADSMFEHTHKFRGTDDQPAIITRKFHVILSKSNGIYEHAYGTD